MAIQRRSAQSRFEQLYCRWKMRNEKSNLWLVAEDSDDDFFFFGRACAHLNSPPKLQRASNGLEAQHYLAGEGPFANREAYPLPSVVVSDLKMPLMDGLELLAWYKDRAREMEIPFVLLTSSNAQSDRDRASEEGVDDYLVKPGRFEDLVKTAMGIWERYGIGNLKPKERDASDPDPASIRQQGVGFY